MIDIKRVVVLGANGTMGAGSAEVFAAGGCDVILLARSTERAREGLIGAQKMAKSEQIADRMSVGTYDGDFDEAVGKADLIFEALAEDIELKKTFFERVDKTRRPESIVATVSSGLSYVIEGRATGQVYFSYTVYTHARGGGWAERVLSEAAFPRSSVSGRAIAPSGDGRYRLLVSSEPPAALGPHEQWLRLPAPGEFGAGPAEASISAATSCCFISDSSACRSRCFTDSSVAF